MLETSVIFPKIYYSHSFSAILYFRMIAVFDSFMRAMQSGWVSLFNFLRNHVIKGAVKSSYFHCGSSAHTIKNISELGILGIDVASTHSYQTC